MGFSKQLEKNAKGRFEVHPKADTKQEHKKFKLILMF
jgi:hypothetical protein